MKPGRSIRLPSQQHVLEGLDEELAGDHPGAETGATEELDAVVALARGHHAQVELQLAAQLRHDAGGEEELHRSPKLPRLTHGAVAAVVVAEAQLIEDAGGLDGPASYPSVLTNGHQALEELFALAQLSHDSARLLALDDEARQ